MRERDRARARPSAVVWQPAQSLQTFNKTRRAEGGPQQGGGRVIRGKKAKISGGAAGRAKYASSTWTEKSGNSKNPLANGPGGMGCTSKQQSLSSSPQSEQQSSVLSSRSRRHTRNGEAATGSKHPRQRIVRMAESLNMVGSLRMWLVAVNGVRVTRLLESTASVSGNLNPVDQRRSSFCTSWSACHRAFIPVGQRSLTSGK